MRMRALWVGASLAVMVVGAVGPWATAVGITVHGTDGGRDGWYVIGAAGVSALLLLIYAGVRKRWLLVIPLVAGLGMGAGVAYDLVDIRTRFAGSVLGGNELISADWGIYLALAGSVSLAVAAVALAVRRSTRTRSAQTAV